MIMQQLHVIFSGEYDQRTIMFLRYVEMKVSREGVIEDYFRIFFCSITENRSE
jgi:hypothetical protein